MLTNEANPDATIIFGAAFDETLEDEMRITLIATGFDSVKKTEAVRRPVVSAEAKPEVNAAPEKEAEAGSEEDIDNIIQMINKSRSEF